MFVWQIECLKTVHWFSSLLVLNTLLGGMMFPVQSWQQVLSTDSSAQNIDSLDPDLS